MRRKFNLEITDADARARRISEAKKKGAEVAAVVEVPGAYEIPFAVDRLLQRKDIDAVATVGAVIKGETKHDEVIMQRDLQASFSRLSLAVRESRSGLASPGPGQTEEQARARAKDYAHRSVASRDAHGDNSDWSGASIGAGLPQDTQFMRRCLVLAQKGEGKVSPNSACRRGRSAKGGKIIGEGFHEKFGGPHAEAKRACAGIDARGATLYVSLEPCSHASREEDPARACRSSSRKASPAW